MRDELKLAAAACALVVAFSTWTGATAQVAIGEEEGVLGEEGVLEEEEGVLGGAAEVDPIDRGADPVDVGEGAGTGVDAGMMGVSIEVLRNAEVVGAAREEIGEIVEIVVPRAAAGEVDPVDRGADPVDVGERGLIGQTAEVDPVDRGVDPVDVREQQGVAGGAGIGAEPGLYAVVAVDNGWFGEAREIVVPVGRFTVIEDGTLMLRGVTAENIGEFEEYAEEEYAAIGDEYGTVGEAYEGLDAGGLAD